ncbi:unnamed protein product [Dovyalis caffra]|uniref:NAC domain-containing protein n=1 Tax=Dovyalis caffra TaxID=77055 RepID=A0AAV1QR55_9ROSI|nr:unnamed protein product [Dovyalis caffra]
MACSSSSMVIVGSLDEELSKKHSWVFPGFQLVSDFSLSDRDLVIHYLYEKEIWDAFGGIDNENLFFFTNLKKMSPTTSRTNRLVGSSDGTWHDERRNKRSGWLGIRVACQDIQLQESQIQGSEWCLDDARIQTLLLMILSALYSKKQPKRKRQLDDEEEGDDGMDKNNKRFTGDRLAMSTTVVSMSVNPPHGLLPDHDNDAIGPLELEQEAATNNNGDEHRSLDGADAPEDQPLLTDDAYSFVADDILSIEPFDSNGALRQHRIVGNGEEMALDDDYFRSLFESFYAKKQSPLVTRR